MIDGLLQSEAYARALLETSPGVSGDTVAARLAARIERQCRVLKRDDPPSAWFVVDHTALYRCVGSAEVMAVQMRHLLEAAARPDVTVQVLRAVAHPATQSSFMVADDAVYAEHVAGGYVFTDQETVSSLLRLFNSIQVESYRASESLTVIAKAGELWTGARQATAGQTAASVELAGDSRLIMVRDSANRDDGTLAFSAEVWQEFTQRLLAKPVHLKI